MFKSICLICFIMCQCVNAKSHVGTLPTLSWLLYGLLCCFKVHIQMLLASSIVGQSESNGSRIWSHGTLVLFFFCLNIWTKIKKNLMKYLISNSSPGLISLCKRSCNDDSVAKNVCANSTGYSHYKLAFTGFLL